MCLGTLYLMSVLPVFRATSHRYVKSLNNNFGEAKYVLGRSVETLANFQNSSALPSPGTKVVVSLATF